MDFEQMIFSAPTSLIRADTTGPQVMKGCTYVG
jgi:hypothetical protein